MNPMTNYSPSLYGQSSRERRNSRTKRDDQGSLSGSEDGHYDSIRHDEHEGDVADLALTSQTLNADGTPKRPMNAFMIFARRRRPQVSAENQALRTGEVSKLLSKEWSSMPSSEKQFYQDQAKVLKDTFNSKYPDYVYRRRPNNSRRRRARSDASVRSVESDMGADGVGEDAVMDSARGFSSGSPTDGDEHFDGSDFPHPRALHQPSSAFIDDSSALKYPNQSRPQLQNNANEMYYRGNAMNDVRLPFPLSERLNGGHSMPPPLLTPRAQTQTTSNYGYGQQASTSTNGTFQQIEQSWNAPRATRAQPALWGDGLSQQERVNSGLDLKPPGMASSDPWESSPTSSTGSSNGSHHIFGGMNSSYNQNQSMASYKPTSSSTPHYPTSSSLHLGAHRSYDPRGTSLLGLSEPLVYPARSMSSRELPPVHTIPGYSSQPSSNTGQMGGQGYQWPREMYHHSHGRNDIDLLSVPALVKDGY